MKVLRSNIYGATFFLLLLLYHSSQLSEIVLNPSSKPLFYTIFTSSLHISMVFIWLLITSNCFFYGLSLFFFLPYSFVWHKAPSLSPNQRFLQYVQISSHLIRYRITMPELSFIFSFFVPSSLITLLVVQLSNLIHRYVRPLYRFLTLRIP